MGNIYRDEYITTILKNINRLDNIYIYNMNKLRKYKDRNKENMDRITILTARLITAMEQNQDLVSKLRYLDTANKKIMQEIYNIQKQSLIVARDNYMLKHDIIKLDELNKILSKISYMTKQYVDSTNVLLYRLGRLTKSKLLYGNKNYKEYKSSGSSDYIIILQEKNDLSSFRILGTTSNEQLYKDLCSYKDDYHLFFNCYKYNNDYINTVKENLNANACIDLKGNCFKIIGNTYTVSDLRRDLEILCF